MELIQLLDDFGQPEMEGKGRNVKEDHGIEYDDKPVVDDPDFLQTEADDEGFDWFCGLREVHLSSQRRRTATFAGSDSDDNTAGESPTAEQGDRNSFNISFLVPSWSSQDQVQVNQEAEVEGVVEKEEVKMDKVGILTRQKERLEAEKKHFVAKMREMSRFYEVGGFRMTNARTKGSRRAEFLIMYYSNKVEEKSQWLRSVEDDIKHTTLLERSTNPMLADDYISIRRRNFDRVHIFYDNFIMDCKKFKDVHEAHEAIREVKRAKQDTLQQKFSSSM